MSIASLFEEFKSDQGFPGGVSNLAAEEIEDEKLQSFENGYGAGWEDALRTQKESSQYVSDALVNALATLQVSQEQTASALLEILRPILTTTLEQILPEIARKSIVPKTVELLQEQYKLSTQTPVEVHVSPVQHQAFSAQFGAKLDNQVLIVSDPMLAEDQIELNHGKSSHRVDTSALLREIGAELDKVFGETLKVIENE